MRQGQQNRRGRGRNRSNKGQNPLTRSFESNGPDVKIRGTPAHIAEKYISYARDALSSGDPVLAENYLQHAEHYNRIIMTYREQNAQPSGEMMNGNGQRQQPSGNGEYFENNADDQSDEEYAEGGADNNRFQHRASQPPAEGEPQPRLDNDGPPRRQQQRGRPHRQRPDRNQDRNNADGQRRAQQPTINAAGDKPAANGSDNGRLAPDEQPEFLRRPVRRQRKEPNGTGADQPATEASSPGDTAEEAVD